MSTTITTTLERPLKTALLHTTGVATCQKCGADVSHVQQGIAEEAQRRIEELEQQVRILTDKATAAGTPSNPHSHSIVPKPSPRVAS